MKELRTSALEQKLLPVPRWNWAVEGPVAGLLPEENVEGQAWTPGVTKKDLCGLAGGDAGSKLKSYLLNVAKNNK